MIFDEIHYMRDPGTVSVTGEFTHLCHGNRIVLVQLWSLCGSCPAHS